MALEEKFGITIEEEGESRDWGQCCGIELEGTKLHFHGPGCHCLMSLKAMCFGL